MGLNFRDPEALYYLARQVAYLGERERALAELERAVEQGYACFPFLARDSWLDPLRDAPAFTATLARAEAAHREAAADFAKAGGDRLLGLRA